MTRDCKSLGLHLRRFESYLQHHKFIKIPSQNDVGIFICRLSSVVEHFHGKEGVSSSNLEGGSIRKNKTRRGLFFISTNQTPVCEAYQAAIIYSVIQVCIYPDQNEKIISAYGWIIMQKNNHPKVGPDTQINLFRNDDKKYILIVVDYNNDYEFDVFRICYIMSHKNIA